MADTEIMDEAEALRFASETSWDVWVKNEEIRKLLTQIRTATVRATKDEMASETAGSVLGAPLEDVDPSALKFVVVGDGAVGKTCLLVVYNDGEFPEEYVPTVFENKAKTLTFKGKQITLRLYDTAGQEEYDRLRPLSYPGTSLTILCFSVASRATFDAITSKWAPEVRHYLPRVPTVLVGLKTDIRDDESTPKPVDFDPVKTEEGEQLAKKIGASAYIEACSKTMKGVNEVFEKAITICWDLTDDTPDTQGATAAGTAGADGGAAASSAEGGDKPAAKKNNKRPKPTCTLL